KKGIKIHNNITHSTENQLNSNSTKINNIIYNHLASLPKSPTKNHTINNTLKSLPKIAELGILHSSDLMVPNLNITKSWHHINYERTGHIKKGKPPNWY